MSDYFGNIPIDPPPGPKPPVSKKRKIRPKKVTKEKVRQQPKTSRGKNRPNTPSSPNTTLFWGAGLVFFVLLYSLAGFQGIPYFIRNILPSTIKQSTGFQLDPGQVQFNPYNFQLILKNVSLSDDSQPILRAEEIQGTLSILHLLRRDFVINDLNIVQPTLSITRNLDTSYNIGPLLGSRKNNTEGFMRFSDLPFYFSLNNITIRDGSLVFSDLPAKKTHRLTNIRVDLPTLSNIPVQLENYIRPHFSAIINGSPVELTGQAWLGEGKQETKLSTTLKDIDISTYAGYLPFAMPFSFSHGIADGTIDLSFHPSDAEENGFSAGFHLKLRETELSSNSKSLQLKAPLISLSGNLNPVTKELRLDKVELQNPTISSFGGSTAKNFSELLGLKPVVKDQPPTEKPYTIILANLQMAEGDFLLFPTPKAQKPASSWENITLQVADYSSTGEKQKSPGTFTFSASGNSGKKSIKWNGSFLGARTLSGALACDGYTLEQLVAALPKKASFKAKGTTRLTGLLQLNLTGIEKHPVDFLLKKANITVDNLLLSNDKFPMLRAPQALFKGMDIDAAKVQLGNISIKQGRMDIGYSVHPDTFSSFSSGYFSFHRLEYAGNISLAISPAGKERMLFSGVNIVADLLGGNGKTKEAKKAKELKDNLNISAKIGKTGSLSLKGSGSLSPFRLTVRGNFTDIPAGDSLRWFSHSSLFAPLEGTLAGKGLFTYPEKLFRGDLEISDGSWTGKDQEPLKWQKLTAHDINFSTSGQQHLGIREIEVNEAEISLKLDATTLHPLLSLATCFTHLTPGSGDGKGKNSHKKITISPFDLQTLRITDGVLNVKDTRLQPSWESQLNNISGSINDLHALDSAAPSPYNVSATLDTAKLQLSGQISPFAASPLLANRLVVSSLPASTFNKQLAEAAGLSFTNGLCSLKLEENLTEQSFSRDGDMHCQDLQASQIREDSKLVLAMQTTQDNIFHLPIHLQQSELTATRPVTRDLLAIFQTMGVKSSISPFLLASDDYSDLIDNGAITFQPGEFMLTSEGREKLTQYSSFLLSHPHIGFTLSGGLTPDQDRIALTQQLEKMEQKRVDAENKKRFTAWQQKKKAFEEQVARRNQPTLDGSTPQIVETDIPHEILKEFVALQPEPVVIDDAMLLELARNRLKVIADSFAAQLSLTPDRISITAPVLGNSSAAAVGSNPGVNVTIRPIAPVAESTTQ